ncbi:MAG: FecR family protein [Bacteroidales bacterium]|jgi:hypothetical protein|nr:FecR family protein [Bacteroidales bacterium]
MEKYLESTRIASLLAKQALNTISEAQEKELESLLAKTGITPEAIYKSCSFIAPDQEEIEAQKKILKEVRRGIAESKKLSGVQHNIYGIQRKTLQRFFRYAAIFVVLLSISLFAYYSGKDRAPVLTPHNDSIEAYNSETVLEMPDGKRLAQSGSTNIAEIVKDVRYANGSQTVGVSVKESRNEKIAEIYKIKVSKGSTHTVILQDGTNVVLYPESELEFPEFFGKSNRSVKLTGEGYFDVQKDASRPFTVTTNSASIVVLGTSFNIRSYNNEKVTETVLVSGKVLMNNIEMEPNQVAILDRSSKEVRLESVDASVYRERAMGMFVFENRSLDEIMREFSLWFGFEYSFESNSLADKRYRIKLPRTDNFNLLMDLMEKTGEMRFVVNENNIEVKSVKQ